jgi:hypothetical protein
LSPAPSNVVGIVSFDVHDCKITNLLLAAVPWSGAWWERNKLLLPSNLGVPQIHISDKIQIRGNQWSFRTEKLGGVFSMNGIFTSPTEAEGSWTLTKGVWFDHQFYFVKQDTSAPWKAHLKKD